MAARAQTVYSTAIGTLEGPWVGVRALDIHHRHVLGTFHCQHGGWGTFADVSKRRLVRAPSAQVPAVGCAEDAHARSRVVGVATEHRGTAGRVNSCFCACARDLLGRVACAGAGCQRDTRSRHMRWTKLTARLQKTYGGLTDTRAATATPTGCPHGCPHVPAATPESLSVRCALNKFGGLLLSHPLQERCISSVMRAVCFKSFEGAPRTSKIGFKQQG